MEIGIYVGVVRFWIELFLVECRAVSRVMCFALSRVTI